MYVCIKTTNAEIHIIDKYLNMYSYCDISFNQYLFNNCVMHQIMEYQKNIVLAR